MLYRDYRRIEGNEDYIISNYGEVFSLKRRYVTKTIEMKPCPDENGYLMATLTKDGKHKTIRIHILVGNAFVGKRENGLTFDHINREKTNNRVDNLRLATRQEQANNRGDYKNNKLGEKYICVINRKCKGKILPCYRIIIKINKKIVFCKDLGFKKYTLEDAIKIRDVQLEKLKSNTNENEIIIRRMFRRDG